MLETHHTILVLAAWPKIQEGANTSIRVLIIESVFDNFVRLRNVQIICSLAVLIVDAGGGGSKSRLTKGAVFYGEMERSYYLCREGTGIRLVMIL